MRIGGFSILMVGLVAALNGFLDAAEPVIPQPPPQVPLSVSPHAAGVPVVPRIPAASTLTPPWISAPDTNSEPLIFDAILKEYIAKPGETQAAFTFHLTNTSSSEIVISDVRTSCGCTVANLPSRPWKLAGGTNGQFGVTVDLRGKFGTITKSVFVNASTLSSATVASASAESVSPSNLAPGNLLSATTNISMEIPRYAWTKPLTVRVNLPQRPGVANGVDDRGRNIQMAMADRQAVFKNDCAKCHAETASGKTGFALYQAACGICHDSHNRATMVPDLHALKHPTDRDHWIKWIAFGRAGSLMPAFAQSEGGPLTEDQIDSLAEYLDKTISRRDKALMTKGPPVLPPLPPSPPVKK